MNKFIALAALVLRLLGIATTGGAAEVKVSNHDGNWDIEAGIGQPSQPPADAK